MSDFSLLACFAHPDDEAFGVAGSFFRYSHEGVRTALICATRGEAGEISDPSLATPETLGQVREDELRDAADVIGVRELIFLGYRDGTLVQADERQAIGRIVREMRRLRPQVVVTFDEKGGYGHPDHITIHRWTTSAFDQAGDEACYPEQIEQGLAPHIPQKLYEVGFARSAMRRMRERMQAEGMNFQPGGNAATIPLEEMGVPDEKITTEIYLTEPEIRAKLQAMSAHRTQMPANSPFRRLQPDQLRAWLGTERFVLQVPEAALENGQEYDLLSGVSA